MLHAPSTRLAPVILKTPHARGIRSAPCPTEAPRHTKIGRSSLSLDRTPAVFTAPSRQAGNDGLHVSRGTTFSAVYFAPCGVRSLRIRLTAVTFNWPVISNFAVMTDSPIRRRSSGLARFTRPNVR